MKQYLFSLILVICFSVNGHAQPFALALNNVDGAPFTCTLLEDLGIYKRLRVTATQTSSAGTWEFPALCSFPGNVWRPYTSGSAPIPFNVIIPPVPNTSAALYNSGNGGASGNLSPVTSGRIYTFNLQNTFTPTASPFICVLETAYTPVSFTAVTQNPVSNAVGENDPVTVTITSSAAPNEHVYVRYTTNNFASTSIAEASFTGTTGTAVIPSFPFGTSVKYYIYSSTKTKAVIESEAALHGEVVHDMSTLEWETNIAQNYSYVVTTTVPVRMEYFRGSKAGSANQLSWKLDCSNSDQISVTVERSSDSRNFQSIHQISADAQRCLQPFTYPDEQPLSGTNYYRIRMQDSQGKISFSQIISILNRSAGWEILGLYPTLAAEGRISLNISSANNMKIDISISNIAGKQIRRQMVNLVSGSNLIPLDVSSLAAGSYFVTAIGTDGSSPTMRFVKP